MRIGIDLGGMSIKAGLVNDAYQIVYKETAPTDVKHGMDKLCADIIALVQRVCKKAPEQKIESIGIGVPGDVNKFTQRIVYCNNIPLEDVDLRGEIEAATGIPTFINNDANVAALGEVIAGVARDFSDAVMITIGTGVGCGIVIDNQIYLGCNGAAGEIGHQVIEVDGLPCACGRRGCYEQYASATALIRMTREAMQAHPESAMWKIAGDLSGANGKTAFDACRAGDAEGSRVVKTYIKYLATGVVDAINLFQPEAIIIGGGISKEGEYLLSPLRDIVVRERYSHGEYQTKLLIAELGNDAGIVGASQLS